MMTEECREFASGFLSKDASFRLFVSGTIGVKEIECLIRKLQIDKDILAEADPTTPSAADNSGIFVP